MKQIHVDLNTLHLNNTQGRLKSKVQQQQKGFKMSISTSIALTTPQHIFNRYAPTIENVLSKVSLEKHPHCTKDELRKVGYLGLIQALETHSSNKGNFDRYARILIQGKLIHYLYAL